MTETINLTEINSALAKIRRGIPTERPDKATLREAMRQVSNSRLPSDYNGGRKRTTVHNPELTTCTCVDCKKAKGWSPYGLKKKTNA